MMALGFRRFMLSTHIIFSVGWLGAVATFLSLAVAGLMSQEPQMVRSVYIAMELSGWFIIVPFCFCALLTGVVQSLGTQWGLFKYYWIVVKLLMTIVATLVLLLHMNPISYIAAIAVESPLSSTQLRGLRIQLIADAGAALLVLLVITAISVYKPWGRIQYRFSTVHEGIPNRGLTGRKSWGLYVLLGLIVLVVLLFVIFHLFSNGLHVH